MDPAATTDYAGAFGDGPSLSRNTVALRGAWTERTDVAADRSAEPLIHYEPLVRLPTVLGDAANPGNEWLDVGDEAGASATALTRLPPTDTRETGLMVDIQNQWQGIESDYRHFYSARGVTALGIGLVAGGLMANTAFDENFLHDTYVENVVLAPSHEFHERFHQPKILGDWQYSVPVFAAAALSEPFLERLPLGSIPAEWGHRSLRAFLVGGPPTMALQWLTGGSRPGESEFQSQWRPLADDNGVSGHAFAGAIPFVSAAKMSDTPWLKMGWYTVSVLPALSRVNDDDHYLSQTFLGWWLAYLACTAVDLSEHAASDPQLRLLPRPDGIDLALEY